MLFAGPCVISCARVQKVCKGVSWLLLLAGGSCPIGFVAWYWSSSPTRHIFHYICELYFFFLLLYVPLDVPHDVMAGFIVVCDVIVTLGRHGDV